MIKYFTKEFSNSLHESIGDWFNSFEEKRNGRTLSEYGFNIIDREVTQDHRIIITIEVYDHAGELKKCFFCEERETMFHSFDVRLLGEIACGVCITDSLATGIKKYMNIKNDKLEQGKK